MLGEDEERGAEGEEVVGEGGMRGNGARGGIRLPSSTHKPIKQTRLYQEVM